MKMQFAHNLKMEIKTAFDISISKAKPAPKWTIFQVKKHPQSIAFEFTCHHGLLGTT